MTSLATAYTGFESLFKNVLGIKTPSLAMHILSLVQKVQENPEKQIVLQEIRNICALSPKSADLKIKLSDCKCLPVRRSSGETEWLTPSGAFAIIDRREYGDLFRNEISTLDFSLEEVHSIQVFLHGLGLEGRYMSRAVKKETTVQGGQLDQRLTEDLRRKAYAICR
jgi:hypothetical protein